MSTTPKTPEEADKLFREMLAEEMTGLHEAVENGGPIYDHQGDPLTDEQALDVLFEGENCIEVPNAGAGSYGRLMKRLGFKDYEMFECCNTGGDWTFVVFDGETWYPVWQSNRYPRHGFSYTLGRDHGCDTKEQLFKVLANYG